MLGTETGDREDGKLTPDVHPQKFCRSTCPKLILMKMKSTVEIYSETKRKKKKNVCLIRNVQTLNIFKCTRMALDRRSKRDLSKEDLNTLNNS